MTAQRQPRKTQPPARNAAPIVPLGTIIQEHDRWRKTQPGKLGRGALRDHWQKLDAQHSQRPDYLLWRELQGTECPPQRKQDPVDLAVRALKSPEPAIHWAALALMPDVMQSPALASVARKNLLLDALRQWLGGGRQPRVPLTAAPQATALLLWLGRGFINPDDATLWSDLNALIQAAQSDWKLGRKPDLGFWESGLVWPLTQGQIARRLALAIHSLIQHQTAANPARTSDLAPWHFTAWMLLRDTRTAQNPARVIEIEVLLAAATTARLGGDADQAGRLAALALNLSPPNLPEPMQQSCRVAAWALAEAGLSVPPTLRVIYDELPFPGDPPASESGQTAARQYLDSKDAAHRQLMLEVENDPDWELLRKAGVVLHHPLAALSWIARKAQSYALKKQHDLLQSAATLATRHHRLTTLGRLLPHLPANAERVLNFAQSLRQSQRRMPFLRDHEIWQDWTRSLRTAWARLEPEAIQDPEQLFILHETLHDREVTLLRILPLELRLLSLRHLHGRKQPSSLVQTLATEPRHMQQLEHQRQVELWSVAAELRERPELVGTVWISLVFRGDPAQGRYSLIVQGPAGRVIHHDRLRTLQTTPAELDWTPLWSVLSNSVKEVNAEASHILAAVDPTMTELPWASRLRETGLEASISFIPSLEWAFRVMRETSAPTHPGEYLLPENTTATLPDKPLPNGTCVLLPTAPQCNAGTRWTSSANVAEDEKPASQRSLQVGAHERILSAMPIVRGPLKEDLIRLCLANATRQFTAPDTALTEEQSAAFQAAPLSPPGDWLRYGV
ncbi:hypothetical protein EI77_00196 [Prosthecobacter fusiformis]|uniref:Uncharacterized protein n=1 Tax=Prosthecobacter fusiformis TaxID=48464 RepID=A0A4R7SQG8_9BACT|nr:hypothetical protein [Prosthecobacter fusiformis]TDU80895.1 hypothetical protein EI77_00196 [Prosthecobacter fusiformis]